MKLFTKEKLLELKTDVVRRLDSLDSYLDLIKVYYNSLAVLQYLDSLGEDNVSQIDLQFWAHANEAAMRKAQLMEDEVLPLFEEMTEFEDSLIRARNMCFHVHTEPQDEQRYYSLLKMQSERLEYYQNLRQLAGIYLDILSEDPSDERYKLWRHYYNRISTCIEMPERGDAEEDKLRLSIAEMKLFIEEDEFFAYNEDLPPCSRLYWQTHANHLKALIKARQP